MPVHFCLFMAGIGGLMPIRVTGSVSDCIRASVGSPLTAVKETCIGEVGSGSDITGTGDSILEPTVHTVLYTAPVYRYDDMGYWYWHQLLHNYEPANVNVNRPCAEIPA